MLSPASWVRHAEQLAAGGRIRTDHDCGPGRTLTVRRDHRGWSAYCFRCNDSGWLPPAPEPLEVRLKRLANRQVADDKIGASVALPDGLVREWAQWPDPCKLWLLKAGLCSADLPALGAGYHPPTDRVVLTVLDPFTGLPLFWQARAVDKRQPKYLAPPVDKTRIIPIYGKADRITLTEDLLSAYKVGLVAEGWCLMGTSLNDFTCAAIVSRGCEVNVWLDPDPPGQRAATKILAKLRSLGVVCRNVVSEKDPKLLHRAQIKEYVS